MATATKICKICGAEYPYCKTVYQPGVFRYQDVACCPEHGAEYLAQVEAARAGKQVVNEDTEENNIDSLADEIYKLIIAEAIDDDEDDEDEYDDDEE